MLTSGGTSLNYNGEYNFMIANTQDVSMGPLANKLMAAQINGEECQSVINGEGNKAFEEYLQDTIAIMENVSQPIVVDLAFDQMIFDEMDKYITGDEALNTLVDNPMEKIKIYWWITLWKR